MTEHIDPIVGLAGLSTLADVDAALAGEDIELRLRHETVEMDYLMASEGLEGGVTAATAEHIAALLAVDPTRPEWLAMVETADLFAGDLFALLEPAPEMTPYFGSTALRAYLMLARGQIEEGASLLVLVAKENPQTRYLEAWLLPRLERDGVSILSRGLGLRLLRELVNGYPEHAVLTAARRAVMRRFSEVALRLVEREGPAVTAEHLMLAAGVCRRAGRTAEGLTILELAPPSWATLTARALLLRHAGQIDEAVAAFTRAGELDPTDRTWLLEAGDALFEAERWTEAEALYQRVLDEEPEQPWALPSARSCRGRALDPRREPDDVVALARSGNARARMLMDDHAAWQGQIPWPSDASARALRALGPGDRLRSQSLSDVEAPSNFTLLRLLFGPDASIDVRYAHVATPDPRAPVAPLEIALWRREGETLVPALAAPPLPIATSIATLAAQPFRRARWWAAASEIASTWTASDLPALLACVVHPLPLPAGISPHEWIPRAQLATAMVVAQLATAEPWSRSARRRGLLAMLHGPMDWSSTAAIVALVCRAGDEPAILTEVNRAFAQLLLACPDRGHVPWYETLLTEWPTLPGLSPEVRDALRTRWMALYAD